MSAYRFIQSKAQAAVFVEDEKAPLPFLQKQTDQSALSQNYYNQPLYMFSNKQHCLSKKTKQAKQSVRETENGSYLVYKQLTRDLCIGLSKSVPSGAKHSQPP